MMMFMVRSIARHQKTEQIGVRQGRSRKKTVRSKQKECAALRYAEAQLQKEVKERKKQEAQQALLETEEKTVEERRRLSEQKQKAWLERKAVELQKHKQHDKERREKRQKKRKEKVEEEEEAMMDNTDKDKDYNPDDDPEADFVEEDQEMDDEDTFKVEKHVHALNFEEAGDYLVAMNRYMEAFSKIVRRGKEDVAREYKKLIKFVKLMIEKHGSLLAYQSCGCRSCVRDGSGPSMCSLAESTTLHKDRQ